MKFGAVTILTPIPTCRFSPSPSNSTPAQVLQFSLILMPSTWSSFRSFPPFPASDAKCRSRLSPVLLTHWLQIRASHVLLLTCVLVVQLCPTLCDPMDCSPPGSSVHGILQAGILEWVAIAFSRGSSRPRDWTQVSCIAARFFYYLGFE